MTYVLMIILLSGQPVYSGTYQTEAACHRAYDEMTGGITKKFSAQAHVCQPTK